MKSFEFRLERVRQYRLLQLELEEVRLQQCFAARQQLEAELAELSARELEASQIVRRQSSSGQEVAINELIAVEDFSRYVKRERARLHTRIQEAGRAIEAQRARVLEANRNHELLLIYKRKCMENWRAAYNRELENAAAELYLNRWAPPEQEEANG